MSAPSHRTRLEAGPLLAGLGAALLLGGLWADWYRPGVSAWTAFEALDLVLALAALAALTVVVRRVGSGLDAPSWALPALGALALFVVATQLIDPPPLVAGRSVDSGGWVALAGALLLLIGGVLTVARVSFDVSVRSPEGAARPPAPGGERAAERPGLFDRVTGASAGPAPGAPPPADRPPDEAETSALDPDDVRAGAEPPGGDAPPRQG